ncbi:apolipoprotein N-acyltransferase [Rheinheimera nanhaiensis]|uniref:Apolipoprotein N-acyltransferase n=1 Tax=Rheinheimera nanhaiensis E407-8 TaxID=562729 RepID=I1E283_9GAMM|nr:apolipoprotein N-acyltransferase [Rheinheimera nanhaiensis]GAB60411.1 apolipoprotein N-acyltransferase [Rheinheimera nanhaiensis E407-8]
MAKTLVTKITPLLPLALLLGAGALNTLAFAPYTLWWLPLCTLALLAGILNRPATANNTAASVSAGRAALMGFSFGLGWFGVGISWVHVSIDQFGGLPLAGSLALMALLVAYLALFPALACWLYAKLSTHALSGWLKPLLLAACWTLAEWLRSVLLTGFPWLSLGYSQTSFGLGHLAPLIGETGISFLLVFSAAALAQLFISGPRWPRIVPALFAAALFVLSPQLSRWQGWHYSEQQLSVLLVQGNIKQELRWVPEQEQPTMLKYMDLTRPHFHTDLVIWPEAAIPRLEPLAEDYLDNLNRAALYANTAVISGILDYNFKTQQAWNNLIVLGKRYRDSTDGDYFYGHGNRYSKHHLLPIGEFVPFESLLRQLAPIFDLPMSSFSRGSYVQPNLIANGYHLLPAICFEIAFPDQIAANMTADTQLLLTVSNDAWFGDSIGPHQHLQIAQMRAREFGRPVLRATNNGITATINANGDITARAPQFSQTVLQDTVQLTVGQTPYARFANTPLVITCALILLFSLVRRWQRRSNGNA